MAISKMQQPRQQYGLGKLVKKAVRGVKKIVKSPIGKAALIGGLGAYGMGWGPFSGGGIKGAGFLKGLMGARSAAGPWTMRGVTPGGGGIGGWAKKWLNPFNKANPLLYSTIDGARKFSGKKAFGLGAAGLIAAPFIQKAMGYGPYEDDEEVDEVSWTQTPQSILDIRNMARQQDPSLAFLPSSNYAQSGFYAADGGRAGLLNGGEAGQAQMEQMLRAEYLKYRNQGGTMPYEQFKILVMKQAQQGQMPNQMMAADGGRARYAFGEEVEQQTDFIQGPQGDEEFSETVVEGPEQPSREQLEALSIEIFNVPLEELDDEQLLVVYQEAMQGQPMEEAVQEEDVQFAANGGRMGFQMGGDDDEDVLNQHRAMTMYRTRKQEGGLMDLGGQEKDYRDEGGFVALGGEERADDVPARLSKNEFVFTADAVRNAGGGDIDRGSEVMQNMMDNLEAGGEISEESQGLEGGEEIMSEEIIDESNPAQGMFDNYEQLQSRVA